MPITVIIGANNSGKTTVLKALQTVLGNTSFLSRDDFNVNSSGKTNKIIIDIRVVPSPETEKYFSQSWESLFTTDRLADEGSYVPIRSIVSYDSSTANIKVKQYVLRQWPSYSENGKPTWQNQANGKEKGFRFEELPFFYVDANRDILEDIKTKSSHLGRIISSIEYSEKDKEHIEELINDLNQETIDKSESLQALQKVLLDGVGLLGANSGKIEVTPFTKKLRDLNKGIAINYKENDTSFPLELHGMGTRSWTSLLTLKSLLVLLNEKAQKEKKPFFPILCIEEPESHLHPHAQKMLYDQILSMEGQKLLSTHSPFVAAQAELPEIRCLVKGAKGVHVGSITQEMNQNDLNNVKQKVLKTRGEMLFAKAIVFVEGETEEVALPIFAEKNFDLADARNISFVGVGGGTGYKPFLLMAQSFKIPWFILSDGEEKITNSLKATIADVDKSIKPKDRVVFLPGKMDFECYLIQARYQDEIQEVLLQQSNCKNDQHRNAKQKELKDMSDRELCAKMKENKARNAHWIAKEIAKSKKGLPPKIIELFDLIKRSIKDISDA